MQPGDDTTAAAAFDDAAFLARSPNRLAVLGALAEEPTPRRALGEEAGVERVTLGRVLDDLVEREWARETADGYALTPTGAWAHDAFSDLLATLRATSRLRGLAEWLPEGLPLRALRDAEVVRPERGDPAAPLRRAERHTRETSRQRVVTDALAPGVLDAMHDGVTGGDLRLEAVVGPSMLAVTAAAPETRKRFADLLASDAAAFRTATDIDIVLGIHDPGVGIGVGIIDGDGVTRALVDTDAPAVREWAVDTFERRWREAEPIDPARFGIEE
ncbi:helix-turn-helix transcriptional regulator [Haloglomus litoreum]|uniref:helix-turn-helix transcriptional regulator n=1 Tax=Haloglomus litoreum TaxID=3034026 RepID=UPI0023E89DE5|nr:hypothetical protein [Haloglomus sp. DT116]